MDTVNIVDRRPQRLFILLIVSVAIHGSVLFIDEFEERVLLTHADTIEHVFRINLSVLTPGHVRIKVPESTLDAAQIIKQSLDYIHRQEIDKVTYRTFGDLPSDFHQEAFAIVEAEQVHVESYRMFSGGNVRVKMTSLLGDIQCFNVLEPDLLDEFSSGVWMLIRC